MTRPVPASERARSVLALVESLQAALVNRLEAAAEAVGHPVAFEPVSWLRDGGVHGGGTRYAQPGSTVFNRASANVSCVYYDDLPDKALASATALSCIVHPRNPHAPSLHMHMSWTELRGGKAYWRLMADLNPSIPNPEHTARFEAAIERMVGERYGHGKAQGERYFFIPALGRHRGVSHFYLEGYDSGDWEADAELVRQLTREVIATYGDFVEEGSRETASEADRATQLAYHTLYLFQVLTLDRGTTSGLLVHGDNDLGILGSLPSHVDRDLLASWEAEVPELQKPLVRALVDALDDEASPAPVDDAAKLRLVAAMRAFYRAHPAALDLQARGDVVPPTVANHR